MGPSRPATRACLRLATFVRTGRADGHAEWHAATDTARHGGCGEPPGRVARCAGGQQETGREPERRRAEVDHRPGRAGGAGAEETRAQTPAPGPAPPTPPPPST